MPANSIEESALRLATFKMDPDETVASYALRYQSECSRFEACVKRATPGRSPYAALFVVLFRNGVIPGIKLLACQKPYPKTMTDAVIQLRRLEVANLTGLNPGRANVYASAMSFTHVPNRTAIAQQFAAVDRRSASGVAGSGSNSIGSGRHSAGARGGGAGDSAGDGRSNRPRPKCSHPGCRKPMGHTTDRCFQKQREEAKRANQPGGGSSSNSSGGGSGSGPGGGGSGGGSSGGGGKRPMKSDN